VEGKDW